MLSRLSKPIGSQLLNHGTRRNLQTSVAVHAKSRGRSQAFTEDFEESVDDGDLFGSRVGSSKKAEKSTESRRQENVASSVSHTKAEQFEDQYTFVWDRLGPNPTYRAPQIRANALRRILRLVDKDASKLEQFTELVAKWRASGRSLDQGTTLEFIDRCILRQPSLLIKIFSDHPKYGMDIPNIGEARRILRALVIQDKARSTPADALQNAVAFAALYPRYGLRTASTDITSCTLLAQACSQTLFSKQHQESPSDNSDGEVLAAKQRNSAPLVSLLPDLLRVLRLSENKPYQGAASESKDSAFHSEVRESGRSQSELLERQWVAAGLREIHRGLSKIGYNSKSTLGANSALDIIKEEITARVATAA